MKRTGEQHAISIPMSIQCITKSIKIPHVTPSPHPPIISERTTTACRKTQPKYSGYMEPFSSEKIIVARSTSVEIRF